MTSLKSVNYRQMHTVILGGATVRFSSPLSFHPHSSPLYFFSALPLLPHFSIHNCWPDSETLTDSQLIMEEPKLSVIHQFWPTNYQWSIVKHSYILHDCTECSHCHVLFLHDCIECFDSHMLFLCYHVLLHFILSYSMLLFGLLTAKV